MDWNRHRLYVVCNSPRNAYKLGESLRVPKNRVKLVLSYRDIYRLRGLPDVYPVYVMEDGWSARNPDLYMHLLDLDKAKRITLYFVDLWNISDNVISEVEQHYASVS